MAPVKKFDPAVYAPLLTALLESILDFNRQTGTEQRSGAWDKVRDARDAVIAAEDSLKAKANTLEAKLMKFDSVPEDERPPGYTVGNQNWIALLETMEGLWAGRRCIELLTPWAAEPE